MQNDYLIELHSHLLPQLDDGSDSVEMSLAMLRCEAEQGVGIVCATPHYHAEYGSIADFCERRAAALKKLPTALLQGMPQIVPAAEVAFFSGMEECSSIERLCIQGTRTLLLEMPFTEWTDLQGKTTEALVLDCRYQVVLVHPERFCFSDGNRRKLQRLAQLPIGLQVNTGSLLHWRTRRLALELLRLARYPLLGSDCHDLSSRPPNLKEGRTVVQRKLGESFLRQMDENIRKAVYGVGWNS